MELKLRYFVRPHDVVEVVETAKRSRDVGSELDADTALGLGATGRVLRVRPHEVAHEALLGRLPVAVDSTQVTQRHAVLGE